MNIFRTQLRRVWMSTFIATLTTATARGADQYLLVDIGTLTNRSSQGLGINQAGDIVGWSHISGQPGTPTQPAIPYINHAYRWFNGTMVDLGAIPSVNCSPFGCESYADDINDQGLIAGWSATPFQIPVIWSSKAGDGLIEGINPLPSLFAGDGNSVAHAINNSNIVVGRSNSPGGASIRAVRWHYDGNAWIVTDLGTLMPNNSGSGAAYDVNNLGQIVAQGTKPGGSLGGFLWLPEPAYGLPAGVNSLSALDNVRPTAINDLGQIVGVINAFQGWIWLPSANYGFPAGLTVLPTFNGSQVYPSGINNIGQIVGTAFVVQGGNLTNRGVLFDNGAWQLLDDFLPVDSPWKIRNFALSADINDAGEITGDMRSITILDINNEPAVHGYLLKPLTPGDLDQDGDVDIADLLALISAWGQCPAEPAACLADIAPSPGDGIVNVADLLALIGKWG
ncbi:MAG: hypothetical protein L0Y42_02075 [Phycisphaerales bacterium]|nr:hypothetical protein [Phycisphaerales bacterium]